MYKIPKAYNLTAWDGKRYCADCWEKHRTDLLYNNDHLKDKVSAPYQVTQEEFLAYQEKDRKEMIPVQYTWSFINDRDVSIFSEDGYKFKDKTGEFLVPREQDLYKDALRAEMAIHLKNAQAKDLTEVSHYPDPKMSEPYDVVNSDGKKIHSLLLNYDSYHIESQRQENDKQD